MSVHGRLLSLVLLLCLCAGALAGCEDVVLDGSIPGCTLSETDNIEECTTRENVTLRLQSSATAEEACEIYQDFIAACLEPGSCSCKAPATEKMLCSFQNVFPNATCSMQCSTMSGSANDNRLFSRLTYAVFAVAGLLAPLLP